MITLLDLVVRTVVVIALVSACLVALTGWAVRTRRLDPFGPIARVVRRLSDPGLRMIERRVVRAGGSPHEAPLWLIGIVVGGGLLLIAGTRWIAQMFLGVRSLVGTRPGIWLPIVVDGLFNLVMIALFIRVIGSWFGLSRYQRWARPVFLLTDWIVEPIRRVMPSVGVLDFSPMVAWLILLVLRGFVLGLL